MHKKKFSKLFINKILQCLKKNWQQNLIWKNTWPLIFDIMFNTWQIFDKNLQQRSILSHSGRLLPFQKWNLKPSHKKEAFWGRKERGRWGWKYYGQRGRERGGCWLLSNTSKIVVKIIIVIAISISFYTLSLSAINKSII